MLTRSNKMKTAILSAFIQSVCAIVIGLTFLLMISLCSLPLFMPLFLFDVLKENQITLIFVIAIAVMIIWAIHFQLNDESNPILL